MILTRSQGQRLVQIIKLMRPDWTKNPVDKILSDANQADGLPAHDFEHALRAAAYYATMTDPGGGYAKRTPNMYPSTGKHWDATAPTSSKHQRATAPQCEDHAGQDATTCRSCHADIKLGHRPPEKLGKRLSGPATPPPPNWKAVGTPGGFSHTRKDDK
ncbi:hypothetical protein [Glutamicibacter creatinolyticus]|uniref:hypothetical protein n=1 Tax=Glutamicibacter creatinolyticus TaxID=162496 RepID=UPI0032172473